ncbi:MAG: hypothetical protein GY778_27205 [bacterium]|nr:hypothetical protein [bacterium]
MQRTLVVGGVPVGTGTLGDDEGGSGPVANSVVRSVAMVEGRLIAGHTTQRPNGSWTGGLFEIDLFTGDRTLLVGEAYLDDGTVSNLVVVPPSNPSGIVVSSPIGIQGIGNGELVFTSVFEHQIYRFDLNTNELVIVSDVEAQVHPNFRGDLRLSGLAVYPAPDCNENGVADCQDVLDLTSDDCNGDGRPDECEIAIGGPAPGGPFFCEADCDPDCNTNGVPDACDIAGGYSVDCDANLIPDECDTDCNTNGIPDSCDIADCPADPACQDCNNNGVPDFCDIRDGAAQDLDTDGIPDECIEWDDEAKADSFWNTALNWQDDIVPGVSGAGAVESVLINLSGTNVVLDTHASVDSLIMGSTSTLNITDVGDLTIDSANGINNRGNFNIGSGRSLIAAAPLGIAGTTPITLAGATALLTSAAPGDTITNAITIQGQGVIDADLVNQGRIVADVIGGTLHINGPDPKVNHGEMIADNGGTMEFNVDVTGSGTFAFRCNAGARGGCTPPIGHVADGVSLVGSTMQILDGAIFELAGSASIDLTGAVALDSGGTMRGAAGSTGGLAADSVTIFDDGITGGQMLLADWMTLDVAGKLTIGCPAGLRGGCTPPIQSAALHVLDSASVDIGGTMTFSANVDLTVEASATFTLAGDLDNRSTSTATFNWVAGPLTMDGSSQSLEAAGEDRGANLAGFTDNFAIGTLRIASGTVVNMVDTFDNQADGNTTCDEALYLTDLILETGAILNTSGCRVYYQHLTDLSGITLGLGSDVLNIATGDFDGDGDVDLDDYSAVYDCHTGPGVAPDPTPPTTPQQCLDPFDADHDGDLDLADVGHFQRLLADS